MMSSWENNESATHLKHSWARVTHTQRSPGQQATTLAQYTRTHTLRHTLAHTHTHTYTYWHSLSHMRRAVILKYSDEIDDEKSWAYAALTGIFNGPTQAKARSVCACIISAAIAIICTNILGQVQAMLLLMSESSSTFNWLCHMKPSKVVNCFFPTSFGDF